MQITDKTLLPPSAIKPEAGKEKLKVVPEIINWIATAFKSNIVWIFY